MYNHNKAQQSKNRVLISWDILYSVCILIQISLKMVPKDPIDKMLALA